MPLNQLIEEHASTVFLNQDHFAASVSRLIGGDAANARSIVGVTGDDIAASNEQRGKGYTHTRTFDFSEDSRLEESDALKIGRLRYEIDSITDPVGGMRTANLVRYQPDVKGGKLFRNGDI